MLSLEQSKLPGQVAEWNGHSIPALADKLSAVPDVRRWVAVHRLQVGLLPFANQRRRMALPAVNEWVFDPLLPVKHSEVQRQLSDGERSPVLSTRRKILL